MNAQPLLYGTRGRWVRKVLCQVCGVTRRHVSFLVHDPVCRHLVLPSIPVLCVARLDCSVFGGASPRGFVSPNPRSRACRSSPTAVMVAQNTCLTRSVCVAGPASPPSGSSASSYTLNLGGWWTFLTSSMLFVVLLDGRRHVNDVMCDKSIYGLAGQCAAAVTVHISAAPHVRAQARRRRTQPRQTSREYPTHAPPRPPTIVTPKSRPSQIGSRSSPLPPTPTKPTTGMSPPSHVQGGRLTSQQHSRTSNLDQPTVDRVSPYRSHFVHR